MSNSYYTASGTPGTGSFGSSSAVRAEFLLVQAGFDKLPSFSPGQANCAVIVNVGGTGMTTTVGQLTLAGNLTLGGAFNTTLTQQASTTLTLPAASDTLVGRATTDTLTNKTISGASNTLSNIGNAALTNSSLTVGSTNIALGATATTIAGLTLTAPVLGTPTSGTLTNCTGLPIAGLTGLGVGVATALAANVTGSGGIALATSPTLTTPTVSGALTYGGVTLSASVSGTGAMVLATSPTLAGTVTMPAGTWDASGIHSLANLAIGKGSAASIVDIEQDQNAVSEIKLLNNSAGASAQARAEFSNGTSSLYTGVFGTGASSGSIGANTGVLLATSSLFIGANSAGIIQFGHSDGTPGEYGRFGTDGSFLVGTTTNAGAGHIADAIGNLRDIPFKSVSGGYTLIAADDGRWIDVSTGNVTVPNSVMSASNSVLIFNASGGNITITQGVGVTLVYSQTGGTGNRTLANNGQAFIYFRSASNCVITGTGLS